MVGSVGTGSQDMSGLALFGLTHEGEGLEIRDKCVYIKVNGTAVEARRFEVLCQLGAVTGLRPVQQMDFLSSSPILPEEGSRIQRPPKRRTIIILYLDDGQSRRRQLYLL
jgi:hypothetical protein